ncbi:tyrosine-protein phosphatase non-receptor type 13-like isoform X2 [Ctenocephalides felis]|uniref:tyrosine-protein phosphatase non-receptor type 13-like isoform X2 n=1 Tax=Ctenocephalides felis TaxID=7515 RepID=UPI000E6E5AC4|nr:tyrosine-protein phosphatase non-receptor type 13-like isoform X2 [Ctenocephalides felis]
MGSNVSRHNGKGLSGRRSQSSGNLCANGRTGSKYSKDSTSPNRVATRSKFCGSLPNQLDAGQLQNEDIEEESDHDNAVYNHPAMDRVEYMTVAPLPRKQPWGQPMLQKNNTFKCERPKPRDRLDLKLNHAPWRGSDGGYDQGYGSERSPEEEYPPSMLGESSRRVAPVDGDPHDIYPFITPECTFTVTVTKGPRGLGLSVSGGTDSRGACPGLIRVKRLFPHQPAWATGRLAPGDLLLAANGCTLTGLSNYEALEVLRTAPATVTLTVCRPPGQDFDRQSPTPSEPPPPPRRVGSCGAGSGMVGMGSSGLSSADIPPPLSPMLLDGPYGEFDIVMKKRSGSLGFTLRREDNSVLGHYVRALVREPALSDGRLRPGDRILAVNGVSMCQLSHEEAVAFLRRCGDEVTLKLYRDSAQTPVGAVSPTESEKNDCSARWRTANGDSGGRSAVRTHLRQEALDMLYDLAARKLSPGDSLGSSMKSQRSPTSSARRFRRLTRTVSPDDSDVGAHHKYYPSTASPSDTDGSLNSSPNGSAIMVSRNTTFTMNSSPGQQLHQPRQNGKRENFEKPTRPNFLDLCQGKPSAAANSYELNNLDNDVLDAPTIYSIGGVNGEGAQFPTTSSDEYATDPDSVILADSHGPVSMPQMSTKNQSAPFNHGQPAYQSAHPTCSKDESNTSENPTDQKQDGTKSLVKWKGVMFPSEDEASAKANSSVVQVEETLDGQILIVELNRGWNSRLGFSLQPDPISGKTMISAIYADSVAARDGRLREGDRLLMVNDESIEHMTTTEVIDLLRIIRGSICIKILRKNAEN